MLPTTTAPEGVDALRELLNAQPIQETSEQWLGTPTPHAVILANTAAKDDSGRGLELWVEFVRAIKHCPRKPDTGLLHGNQLRVYCADLFGIDDKQRLASFYTPAERAGLIRRVDEEQNNQPGQGRKVAGIFEVNEALVNAAIHEPERFAPKAVLPHIPKKRLSDTVRARPRPVCRSPRTTTSPKERCSDEHDHH